jgi:hypothetical protein
VYQLFACSYFICVTCCLEHKQLKDANSEVATAAIEDGPVRMFGCMAVLPAAFSLHHLALALPWC